MAAIIRAYHRDSASYRATVDGPSAADGWVVDGALGNGSARLADALTAPGLPALRDPHPSLAGLVALEVTPRPLGPGQVLVVVTWGLPPLIDELGAAVGTVIARRWSTATVSKLVTKDNTGTPMTLTYTGVHSGGFRLSQQTQEAEIQFPTSSVEYERIEAALPAANGKAYAGRVNDAPWNGDAARTWLCVEVASREIRGRTAHAVSYRFAHDPDTWAYVAKVRLAGLVPHDAVGAGGEASFNVYPEADFSALTGFSF